MKRNFTLKFLGALIVFTAIFILSVCAFAATVVIDSATAGGVDFSDTVSTAPSVNASDLITVDAIISTPNSEVTILVADASIDLYDISDSDIMYMDQQTADSSGRASISFYMPIECAQTTYAVYVGGTDAQSVAAKYFELPVDNIEPETGSAKWGASLSLEDAVEINLYVGELKNASGGTETNPSRFKVVYTFNGVTEEQTLTNAALNKIVVASCAAKELADEVSLRLYYDDNLIDSVNYSAKTYCENQITANKDSKLVDLCYALLEYGAYAQQRFNHNTENLANETYNINNVASTGSISSSYDLSVGSYGGVVAQLGASLSLEAKTEINVYFKPLSGYSADNYSATVDGTPAQITTTYSGSEEICRITLPGIAAKDLGTKSNIEISNGSNSVTLSYAPMSYAYRNRNSSTEGNICKALYCYYLAADAYFAD